MQSVLENSLGTLISSFSGIVSFVLDCLADDKKLAHLLLFIDFQSSTREMKL